MTRDGFIALCGARLYHVTAAANAPRIEGRGLLCASALAVAAGIDPAQIALRSTRQDLGGNATLNHQKPLRMGRGKDAAFLEGHSLHSWALQLDRRIYFAPRKKLRALRASFEIETTTYEIDTGRLFDAYQDHLWLSPINSGNADRKPVMRGDWIYVPATAPAENFRTNRIARGLKTTRDTVQEISLTCAVPPPILQELCL